jgi:hypothetical protein
MSKPTPQIGDVDVRGYVLPATCAGDVEALESIYGQRKSDTYNPLIFSVPGTGVNLPEGTEVLFDIVASRWDATKGVATNVRRA